MFETYKEAELQVPKLFLDADTQAWDYIFRRIHTYWFHVVAHPVDEDSKYTPKIFYFDILENLQALNLDHSFKITELSLVTPGYMNGTENWKMELLEKIIIGFEPNIENRQTALIFVLKNGNRYIASALDTLEENLLNLSIVYEV